MRRRYAPWRVSTRWSLAARPTDAERFVRDVSLRWERAAEELEELLRARGRASERGSSRIDAGGDASSEPPSRPRAEPLAFARRAGGTPGTASGMERAGVAAPARGPSGGPEEREEGGAIRPDGALPPARTRGSPVSAAPPHPARARESARDDPVGLPARGEYPALRESASSGARREALRDGRDRPSSGRGEPGAGELDPPVSVPAASREMDLFDADLAGEPRGAALPGEGIPRRVPVERRAGDGPRDRARREGEEGLGIAAVRSGGLPEVGAGSLGSDARRRREASVESILDEARRRAEAIAEWERTGF